LLDINPAAKGHLLLLPKEHYSIMPQIPPETLSRLFMQAKLKSKLLLKSLKAEGTTLFAANGQAAGQRVPHFLLHLLHRKEGDGLLAAKEQLMLHENQDKLLAILKEQFAALSGIKSHKKPVIKSDASPDHKEESTASAASVKKKTLRKSKTASEKKTEQKKKKSESDVEQTESTESTQNGPTQNKPTQTESKSTESSDNSSSQSVSLDDIANLFK
ncbi:HIT family protein, partial [Candidatus Woesearchaeota archaeon]|nr:HIT family protein [Candidatus Woesearchaeota archaeon]